MQMPRPEMALQEALAPHEASPARRAGSSVVGEHMRAQYLSPVPASWSAHWGLAVTPAGSSVGQAADVHLGAQISPPRPWIVTLISSGSHPTYGSP